MVEGRGAFEWAQTANLLALEINMNRKKGTKAVSPSSLNPFVNKPAKKVILNTADSMALLKSVFFQNQK